MASTAPDPVHRRGPEAVSSQPQCCECAHLPARLPPGSPPQIRLEPKSEAIPVPTDSKAPARITFRDAVGGELMRSPLEILQINVGKLCNQTCVHCHVNAGPNRSEQMTEEAAEAALGVLDRFPTLTTVDVTGGAPEMSPWFRRIVTEARKRDLTVIDRCNLTILLQPGHEDLAQFLADQRVTVVASLPCYSKENVDAQRGDGVFQASIEALRLLNSLGYGRDGERHLDLVFNPVGASLPPAQGPLEAAYKEQLAEHFDITFDHLYTITNMIIARFESFLRRTGELEGYERLLEGSFNPATIPQLMCRNTLSVSWDGYVYDCDFNQMLDLRLENGSALRVGDVTPELWDSLGIITGRHCFGCTAGAGSSCSGALT